MFESTMSRRAKTLLGISIGLALAFLLQFAIAEHRPRSVPELVRLVRARRAFNFVVTRGGFLPRNIRDSLIRHLDRDCREKQNQLRVSTDVWGLAVYAPDALERKALLATKQLESNQHYLEVDQNSSKSEDIVTFWCLPADVTNLQSQFCCITNHTPIGPLARLAGFRADDIDCHLPDGAVVDLSGLQTWLNESTEAGWRVGVWAVHRTGKETELAASRGKTAVPTQNHAPPPR